MQGAAAATARVTVAGVRTLLLLKRSIRCGPLRIWQRRAWLQHRLVVEKDVVVQRRKGVAFFVMRARGGWVPASVRGP